MAIYSKKVEGLTNGDNYFAKVYTVNHKERINNRIDLPYTSVIPKSAPSVVTNLRVSGDKLTATISWANPSHYAYYQTVIVQKTGSASMTVTDGKEVYRGAGTSVSVSDLPELSTVYFTAFTVNEYGEYSAGVSQYYETPKGGRLPTGYTELTYIQNTGAQYIDTGFIPNNNTRVVAEVALDSTLINNTDDFEYIVYGAADSEDLSDSDANWFSFYIISDGNDADDTTKPWWHTFYYGTQGATTNNFNRNVLTSKFTADQNKNQFAATNYNGSYWITDYAEGFDSVEGTAFKNQSFNIGITMTLFTINASQGRLPESSAGLRIYSFKIYNNGTLVRDFIPAKNSNNVVGLYDIANSKFYTNAGSGNFTAGSIVNN